MSNNNQPTLDEIKSLIPETKNLFETQEEFNKLKKITKIHSDLKNKKELLISNYKSIIKGKFLCFIHLYQKDVVNKNSLLEEELESKRNKKQELDDKNEIVTLDRERFSLLKLVKELQVDILNLENSNALLKNEIIEKDTQLNFLKETPTDEDA